MTASDEQPTQLFHVRDWRWEDTTPSQQDYLRLKFDVFVDELGLTGIPSRDGLARPDPFDPKGRFVSVEASAGQTVGIGRLNWADDADALPTAGAFPELKAGALARLAPPLRTGAVTNVALMPPYRGLPLQPMGRQGTHPRVSDLLMLRIIALARKAGVDVLVLLTRPGSRAEGLFARFGFACSAQRYRYEKLGLEANRWLAQTVVAATAAERVFDQIDERLHSGSISDGSKRTQQISEILRSLWPARVPSE